MYYRTTLFFFSAPNKDVLVIVSPPTTQKQAGLSAQNNRGGALFTVAQAALSWASQRRWSKNKAGFNVRNNYCNFHNNSYCSVVLKIWIINIALWLLNQLLIWNKHCSLQFCLAKVGKLKRGLLFFGLLDVIQWKWKKLLTGLIQERANVPSVFTWRTERTL